MPRRKKTLRNIRTLRKRYPEWLWSYEGKTHGVRRYVAFKGVATAYVSINSEHDEAMTSVISNINILDTPSLESRLD